MSDGELRVSDLVREPQATVPLSEPLVLPRPNWIHDANLRNISLLHMKLLMSITDTSLFMLPVFLEPILFLLGQTKCLLHKLFYREAIPNCCQLNCSQIERGPGRRPIFNPSSILLALATKMNNGFFLCMTLALELTIITVFLIPRAPYSKQNSMTSPDSKLIYLYIAAGIFTDK